jgi:hypothetical protein
MAQAAAAPPPTATSQPAAPAPPPAAAPQAAAAPQPAASSESLDQFSLGMQWVGGSNTGLYGRYNGFTEQGLDVLGDFAVARHDPWDSGKTWYYEITGVNLNFQTGDQLATHFHDNTYTNNTSNDLGPTAELSLKFGNQGSWAITADYDAISYTGNIIDSIYTTSGTTATLNANFPPWGGATNFPLHVGTITSYTVPALLPAEMPVQVGTRRDILSFSGQTFLDDWTLGTNIRHEHKEGTMEESVYATYGGIAFARPIDYDTDRFDVTAAYNLPDLQASLQYTYSKFTDNNGGLELPRPASVVAPLSATSGPFAQTGLYSTPPTTSAHYITAMFGDNLAPATRVTLNLRGGVELQNDTFPANSADPGLSSTLGHPAFAWFNHLNSLNQGTSATSPDDVAWVYQGKLAVTSKLATDLEGQASYSFDGRDVHLNQFEVWTGGTNGDATANTPAFVVPQDWFKQTAKVEADYKILPEDNTKLMVGYAFNDIDRTNAQVEHSITNTETVQLSSMLGTDILGRISYDHGDRTGSLVYGTAWGNLINGIPQTYNTPSGAYYQAPMTSDSVTFRADYAAPGEISGGLFLKYANERYNYPAVPNSAAACAATPGCVSGDWTLTGVGAGIKRDYNLTVGPDVNYRPNADMNLHFYYTYEKIFFDNLGNGACAESNIGVCAGSAGYFQNTYTSNMNTAGLNGTWQVNSKLKIAAEYNMSSGAITFGEFNGVQVIPASVSATYQNVLPYPNINSVMNQLKLSATYQLATNIACSLMYQFSMFRNNDWDDVAAPIVPTTNTGTAISILNAGYAAPHYDVSTIGTVLKVTL